MLEKSGVKYVSMRPVYILGPNNYIDREKFIYSKIKNSETITLPGNGEAMVQFVFVKEVAESIVLLATRKLQGAFNCAGDEAITLNGLVNEMGKIIGKNPVIKHNASTDGSNWNDNEFPFGNENFFCDNSKIKNLGIKFTPLLSGLKSDFKNYYKNVI